MQRAAQLLIWLVLASALPVFPGTGATAEGIRISGRILDVDGQPARAARLRLVPILAPFEQALLELAGEATPASVATAGTDDRGAFQIDAPEAGFWWLLVAAPDRMPMELGFRREPLLGATTVATLELEAAERVAVRVVDASGAAVSGAWIDPRLAQRADPRRWSTWRPHLPPRRTGGEGQATLDLPTAAGLELQAWKAGYSPSPEVLLRSAPARLVLTAARARHLMLADDAGRPIAGAVVRTGSTGWPAARSDDAGRVTIHNARVTILSTDDRRARLRLADNEGLPETPFEFTMPSAQRLAGRIVDREDRRPIADAFVYPTGAVGRFVRSDANGSFSLTTTEGTDSWISASAQHYLSERSRLPTSSTTATIALPSATDLPGVVIDAAGQPVAGATIQAAPHSASLQGLGRISSGPSRQATTDVEGRFTLLRLAAGMSYAVSASADGLAPAESIVTDLPRATSEGGVVLRLDTGALVSGQVIDPAGVGVVGATITLEREPASEAMRFLAQSRRQPRAFHFELATVAGGEFSHPLTPAGRFTVTVEAAGFPTRKPPAFEIEAGMRQHDLGVISLEPGVDLTGRVIDPDGLPLAAAKITATEPQSRMMTRFTRSDIESETDSDGIFTIVDRRAGEHLTLSATLAGYASREIPLVEVPTADFIIVLEPAVTLRGGVADPESQAIANASVSIVREGGGTSFGGEVMMQPIAHGITDQRGRFEIADIEPGTVRVSAEARGWLESETLAVTLVAGSEPEQLEIELRRGASVSGRVIGPDGGPVADAHIGLEDGRRFSPSRRTTSDGNGAYQLGGIEPGQRMIAVTSASGLRSTQELDVQPGDNRLDFYLEAGVEISGTVVDSDSQPVAGAAVTVSSAGSFSVNGNNVAETDTGGEFTINNVQPGTVTVTAVHRDFAATSLDEPIEVNTQPVTGLLLRMATGTELTGSLLGADSSDLAAMQIMAVRRPSTVQQGTADSDGFYRVPNLGPGSWQVMAQASSGQRATGTVEIAVGEAQVTLDLEFGGGLTLTGRVLLAGEPLTGAWIAVVGTDSSHSSQGETNYEGRFELKGLEAGSYTVQITDFADGISHTEQLEILRDDDVVIEIEGGTISGRVSLERGGLAVAGASVILEPISSDNDGVFRAQPRGSTTDGEGRFQLTGIAAGDYRLQATKEGYAAQTRTLQIDSGADLDGIDFELIAAEGLALLVQLPSGGAPATISYAVLDLVGSVILTGHQPASNEGRVRLETVPDGDWTLVIEAAGSATHSLRTLVPNEDLPVQLATAAALELRVEPLVDDDSIVAILTIRGDDGLPFRALGWNGDVEDQWRLYAGQATLDSLPAGRWILAVTSSDGRSWEQSVVLAAGSNDTVVFE